MKVERGIILPFIDKLKYISNPKFGGALELNPISPLKLRFALLYWDKIALVESAIFNLEKLSETSAKPEFRAHCRDLITLQRAGVLRLEGLPGKSSSKGGSNVGVPFNYSGVRELYNIHAISHIDTISKLTNDNPGQWACGKAEQPNFVVRADSFLEDIKKLHRLGIGENVDNERTQRITGDVELINCLPIPPINVSLEEILEFKLKRESELIALRVCLDDLYLAIANSSDIPRAKINQIQKLELALRDLEKTTHENWRNRLLKKQTISVDLNLETITKGIVAGAVGSSFTTPLGGLISGAAYSLLSSIKFTVSNEEQLKSRIGNQIDLSYIQEARNNGVVDSSDTQFDNFATMTLVGNPPSKSK